MAILQKLFVSYLAVAGAHAASAVLDLIPSNFDDVVLKSGKPALVEFFAPWCGRKSPARTDKVRRWLVGTMVFVQLFPSVETHTQAFEQDG
jgi:Thioredoxin